MELRVAVLKAAPCGVLVIGRAGAAEATEPGCLPADAEDDGDVDLVDFRTFPSALADVPGSAMGRGAAQRERSARSRATAAPECRSPVWLARGVLGQPWGRTEDVVRRGLFTSVAATNHRKASSIRVFGLATQDGRYRQQRVDAAFRGRGQPWN